MLKVLKNSTMSSIFISSMGLDIPASSQIEVDQRDYALLASDDSVTELTTLINSGDIVVNDGSDDLPSSVGIAHIETIQGVIFEHNDVALLPAAGENAPELAVISDATLGHCMRIGNQIFAQTRIDNYAGGDLELQVHMSIDNLVADRWVQFELSYITTNGIGDKAMDSVVGTVQSELKEVPSDLAHRVFEIVFTIPASAFSSGEKYLFGGIKRITATGKTAPTNHPVTYRYCKRYYKKVRL